MMKVTSTGITNGSIEDRFGKRGTQFDAHGMPTESLPFHIEGAPAGTVSYALVLDDIDAYPVSGGFVWIHWLAANLTRTELKAGESRTATDFAQGANSWMGTSGREDASFYGGMAPPNAPHLYRLHIYALDTKLDVENGFFLGELYKKMDGHILEEAVLKGTYQN